jgi:putative ABC transport system permease protein
MIYWMSTLYKRCARVDSDKAQRYPNRMPIPIYLSLKEIWRNKWRFVSVALVITLITTLVLFVAALAEGLGTGNREYISKLDASLLVYQENTNLFIGASRLGRSRVNDVTRIPGVSSAGLIGVSNVNIIAAGLKNALGVALIGVQPGKPGEPAVLVGRTFHTERANEAILDRAVVLRSGLKVGDQFIVKAIQGTDEQLFTLTVAGISDGQQYSLQPSIFVPILTWDRIRPQPALVAGGQSELAGNVIAVKLANPRDVKGMEERIAKGVTRVQVVDLKTAYENAPGYSAQQSTLNTQQYFTLLIGLLVIGGFFQIQTLQKVAQIGMLKAIGTPNLMIAVAAIIQILAITALGVSFGAFGTYLLSLSFPKTIPIVFSLRTGLVTVATLLAMGPIGGLVSVRFALRIEPLRALGLAS